jgi:hypothetical protein
MLRPEKKAIWKVQLDLAGLLGTVVGRLQARTIEKREDYKGRRKNRPPATFRFHREASYSGVPNLVQRREGSRFLWNSGGMKTVELYARVRRTVLVEGISRRAAAREFGLPMNCEFLLRVRKFETGCEGVSGKPHRKKPERVVLLKGFRRRCEVSGNLIFSVRRKAHSTRFYCRIEGGPACRPSAALVPYELQAATGLRISEALGLKWSDIDPKAELIHVRRSWTMDRIGKPKSQASRAAVPCIPLLAKHLEEWRRESPYAGDDDWVFASVRNKGKTPRSGSILVTDYLKKAAYDAGMLKPGEKVQFGMHNLRHSLATYLIAVGCDVKTVQGILRHSNPLTTLQLYAHGRSQDRSYAQGEMLTAFFAPPTKLSPDMVQ